MVLSFPVGLRAEEGAFLPFPDPQLRSLRQKAEDKSKQHRRVRHKLYVMRDLHREMETPDMVDLCGFMFRFGESGQSWRGVTADSVSQW